MRGINTSPQTLLALTLVLLMHNACCAAPLEVSTFSINIIDTRETAAGPGNLDTAESLPQKPHALQLTFAARGEALEYLLHYQHTSFLAPDAKLTVATANGPTERQFPDVQVFGGPTDGGVLIRVGKMWRGTVQHNGRFVDIETVERDNRQLLLVRCVVAFPSGDRAAFGTATQRHNSCASSVVFFYLTCEFFWLCLCMIVHFYVCQLQWGTGLVL